MSETYHEADARRRLVAAQDYAARVERERPHDHAAVARAEAYVRRLKRQWREATETGA